MIFIVGTNIFNTLSSIKTSLIENNNTYDTAIRLGTKSIRYIVEDGVILKIPVKPA